MDKAALLQALPASLARIRKDIERLAQDAVRLTSHAVDEAQLAVGASKLGGAPDLPSGAAWPAWKNLPMSFIAQVRLSDVRPFDTAHRLPAAGLLLFFYDSQQQTYGADPEDGGGWNVRFIVERQLRRTAPPAELRMAGRFSPCALTFAREVTLPQRPEAVLPQLDWTSEEQRLYDEFLIEELREREKRLAGDILASLRRLYDIVALPIEATGTSDPLGIEWIDLRAQPLSGEKIQERVLEALRHWVFDRVTPVKLVGLTRLGQDETTQTLSCATLVGFCFSFLNFPKLLGSDPIRAAIAQGVHDGVLGYSAALQQDANGQPFVTDHRLVKIDVSLAQQEIDLSATSYLIAPELARRLAQPPQPVQPEPVAYPPPAAAEKALREQTEVYTPAVEPAKSPTKVPATSGRRYRLRFTTNKQQLFRAFRPLQNLAEKAGSLDVTLEIIAQSDTPLEASWLRNAVEEPLDEADVSFDGGLED